MTLSSPIKTEADRASIESILPPFGNGVCQSGEEADVGNIRVSSEEALHRLMTAAFLRWHGTGCFAAAADCQKARQAWELALMEKDSVA